MPSGPPPLLVWFRHDLRLADNPALRAALAAGGPVIPVYIHAPGEESPWTPGAASRWWLHHALERLDDSLRARGSQLVLRTGPSLDTLVQLARETGARGVHWNRRYEPAVVARDSHIKESLRAAGIDAESHNAALLHEPWSVLNQSGKPFQVFTPFWKACLLRDDPPPPFPPPQTIPPPTRTPPSLPLPSLDLLPRISWDSGLREAWTPGEVGALTRLERFAAAAVLAYTDQRDHPDRPGTSRLSPHLHFGEVGPRQVWHAVRRAAERADLAPAVWRRWQFLAEIGWREFAHHLLYHFPHTPASPLRTAFERFPWRTAPDHLAAWKQGRTGVPLVDAGMRELWTTGWMHNRVRMVVGSFLVKNLRISWSEGARWFWDTLVDADLASNTLGWQWVGGCGADAAPYFRIFNPVSQGKKFDPDGHYVRRWVPELGRLPAEYIHTPWEAPAPELHRAGINLGRDYPGPIVDLHASRIHALAAFASIREAP